MNKLSRTIHDIGLYGIVFSASCIGLSTWMASNRNEALRETRTKYDLVAERSKQLSPDVNPVHYRLQMKQQLDSLRDRIVLIEYNTSRASQATTIYVRMLELSASLVLLGYAGSALSFFRGNKRE